MINVYNVVQIMIIKVVMLDVVQKKVKNIFGINILIHVLKYMLIVKCLTFKIIFVKIVNTLLIICISQNYHVVLMVSIIILILINVIVYLIQQ